MSLQNIFEHRFSTPTQDTVRCRALSNGRVGVGVYDPPGVALGVRLPRSSFPRARISLRRGAACCARPSKPSENVAYVCPRNQTRRRPPSMTDVNARNPNKPMLN